MTNAFSGAKAEIMANFEAQHQALLANDTDRLRSLLSEGYTRTRINGQTITREQWLKQLASGEIQYHGYEFDTVTIKVDGTAATLVGLTHIDATLYGERKKWRVASRVSYFRSNRQWLPTRSVSSRW